MFLIKNGEIEKQGYEKTHTFVWAGNLHACSCLSARVSPIHACNQSGCWMGSNERLVFSERVSLIH